MDFVVMGMEDRDWYREKRIDWNSGGLKDGRERKRRVPGFVWWIIAAVLSIVAFHLFRGHS